MIQDYFTCGPNGPALGTALWCSGLKLPSHMGAGLSSSCPTLDPELPAMA